MYWKEGKAVLEKDKNNCIILALEVLHLHFPGICYVSSFPNGWTFLHSPATADYCSNCEETPSAEQALNPGDAVGKKNLNSVATMHLAFI